MLRKSAFALVLSFVCVSALNAASISFSALDVMTPFTGAKDVQESYGLMFAMSAGRYTLIPDLVATHPNGQKVNVVAVLQSVDWAGGHGDPIAITAVMSTKNVQTLKLFLAGDIRTNRSTKFSFGVTSFDPVSKQWYRALDSNQALLSGVISSLQIGPAFSGLAVGNGTVQMVIAPAPLQQDLFYGTGIGIIVKRWGVTVAQ